MADRELITIQEFLSRTGLKERKSAYTWMRKGHVEWVMMGGRRYIYADSIVKPGTTTATISNGAKPRSLSRAGGSRVDPSEG